MKLDIWTVQKKEPWKVAWTGTKLDMWTVQMKGPWKGSWMETKLDIWTVQMRAKGLDCLKVHKKVIDLVLSLIEKG